MRVQRGKKEQEFDTVVKDSRKSKEKKEWVELKENGIRTDITESICERERETERNRQRGEEIDQMHVGPCSPERG